MPWKSIIMHIAWRNRRSLEKTRRSREAIYKARRNEDVAALAVAAVVALGDEIKPFDRLGSSTDYNYRTHWGSYNRMVTSFKHIEVTIVQPRKEKHPLKLEFFFVIKGGNRYAKKAGEADFPEGEGSAIFSTSTRQEPEPIRRYWLLWPIWRKG
jgi:hypothetical protein